MKVSIIGLGNIGSSIATHLSAGGTEITVADESSEKSRTLADRLGKAATAATVAEAIKSGDVVIFAVWFDVIKKLLATYASALAGKIIVDPSNPIAPDGKGGFKKTIAEDESSGRILSGLVPAEASFVKAFGTLGADSLASSSGRQPDPAVLFYATDDKAAGGLVADLIVASGFYPLFVGGIDKSIRIEVGGDLHQFGKLGKLVSASEAAPLI